jgi:hypothetical protein
MTARRFDRRRFLAAAGLGAAALPLLGAEQAEACLAQGPKRVFFIVFCNGAPKSSFFPAATGTGTGFTLPAATRPFEPFKQKMLVIDGAQNRGAMDNGGGGHLAYSSLLTGLRPAEATEAFHTSIANGISIDQYLGLELEKTVKLPRRSLYLGALNNDGSTAAITSYLGARKAVTPEEDGYKLASSLFAGIDPAMANAEAQARLAKLRAARRSVFDHVTGDLGRVRARLGREDREKIDFHLESVVQIDRQLATAPAGGVCGKPTIAEGINFKNRYSMDKILTPMLDIAVMALASDVTRVVNLSIGDSWADMLAFPFFGGAHQPTGMRGSQAGGGDDRAWHAHSHRGGAEHIRIVTWIFERVVEALKKMDSIQEGDRTLLDNTAVVLLSNQETGGGHEVNRIPLILFGSCGGTFKVGRAINVGGRPLNGLYVSLANALGIPAQTFNNAAYGGAWAGLTNG